MDSTESPGAAGVPDAMPVQVDLRFSEWPLRYSAGTWPIQTIPIWIHAVRLHEISRRWLPPTPRYT